MGALSVSGRASDADQPLDDGPADDGAQEQQGAPEAEGAERDDAGRFVPAAALVPESAASRRERHWQERVSAHVKPIEERLTGEIQTYKQQLEQERQARADQAQAVARLQGQIEAMQRQPVQQQSQQQGPDPTELRRKAREALQANNIDEYERLNAEALEVVADRKAEARIKQFQEQFQRTQAPQLPPHIQQMLYQSPNVAN